MSKTVLVVDDEALIAMDIQTQLEDLGHKVVTAQTVAEAVALVQAHHIDVAIVDWHLRTQISAPLVSLLKQERVPFVLCSGSGLDELTALFPCAPILSKPFAAEALTAAVDQLVETRRVN